MVELKYFFDVLFAILTTPIKMYSFTFTFLDIILISLIIPVVFGFILSLINK